MVAVTFADGIEEAWSNVAVFVPKLAGALATLLIGWLCARLLRNGAQRILTKLRFDEFVDRGGLGKLAERAGFTDSSVLLAKTLYYAVMLLVLKLSIDVLGDSQVQAALSGVLSFLPRVAAALLILVLTGVVAARVRDLMAQSFASATYVGRLAQGAAVAVWVLGGFAAANQLDVAHDVVTTLFQAAVYTLGLTFVIKFGVGGVASARDRFWPRVYDKVQGPLPPRPMLTHFPQMQAPQVPMQGQHPGFGPPPVWPDAGARLATGQPLQPQPAQSSNPQAQPVAGPASAVGGETVIDLRE